MNLTRSLRGRNSVKLPFHTAPAKCWTVTRWALSAVRTALFLGLFLVVIYVYPPYKMKQTVDLVWDAGRKTGAVLGKVVESEEHAKAFAEQTYAKAGEIWQHILNLDNNPKSQANDITPVIQVSG